MIHLPPRTTLTATLFPYTPLFRSCRARNLRVEILLHFPRIEGLRIVVRFLAFVGDDFRLRAVFDLVPAGTGPDRSEEHTSELQSLMRISYAVFCLKKKKSNFLHTSLILLQLLHIIVRTVSKH